MNIRRIFSITFVWTLIGISYVHAGTWTAHELPILFGGNPSESARWYDALFSGDGSTVVTSYYNNFHGGNLWISFDSGETWSTTTQTGYFTSIDISDDGDTLVGKVNLTVSKSQDSGMSWSGVYTAGQTNGAVAISGDAQIMVASDIYVSGKGAATGGYIYKSIDGGTTWSQLSGYQRQSWATIDVTNDGQIIVAAANTRISATSPKYFFISTDGGTTWATSTLGSRDYTRIVVSDDGSKLLILDSYSTTSPGYVHISNDGGSTYASTTLGLKSWVDGDISSDGQKMVVMENSNTAGNIYYSSDGGDTWSVMSDAGTRNWAYIDASDDLSRIVAIDTDGYVYTYYEPPVVPEEDPEPTPTTESTRTRKVSSSSASSRVHNLIAQGNIPLAQQVASQYGIAIAPLPESSSEQISPIYRFERDLESGYVGDDVRSLQQYLNMKGFTLALSGPGSSGNETTIFGPLTRSALARFQAAHNISPAVGFFGPLTRAFIQANP